MAISFQQGPGEGVISGSRVRTRGAGGFTLIELLVSTAIMLIVMLVLLQVIAGMTNIWHNSTGTISTFQSARAAFTTLTRTLSRATLKTYIDYVDTAGLPITEATVESGAYTPIASFARQSELQFICGPMAVPGVQPATTSMLQAVHSVNTPANAPGDYVFFQAPLGIYNADTTSVTGGANDKFLLKSLNTVGFYTAFYGLSPTNNLPTWLSTALNVTAANPVYRSRLMEYILPTEDVDIYNKTSAVATGPINNYYQSFDYIPSAINATTGSVAAKVQDVILAENIALLIVRPRIEPQDEKTLAGPGGALSAITPYSATTANSIISPNYNYDSRAWWGGASTAATSTMNGTVSTRIANYAYVPLMRNQLPPILDIAMVALDPNSIVRLANGPNSFGVPTMPTVLQVPATMVGAVGNGQTYATPIVTASPFAKSVNMDVDLNNYGLWLAYNHVRFRIFRASVQMEGAAWVNN